MRLIHIMRCIISPLLRLTHWLQIHHNRLLRITHNDPLARLIGRGIDLLMRYKGWHINKITRLDFLLELHMVAPAHLAMTGDNIDNRLDLAVMVNTAGRVRGDDGDATPDALRACQLAGDGGHSL